MNRSSILSIIFVLLASNVLADGQTKEFDLGNGITVQIEEAKFNPESHKIENCEGSNYPCLIDGVFPFGTAFSMPKTYLKSLTLSKSGKSYKLQTTGMYNAWGNRPLEFKGKIKYLGGHCYDEKNCALRGLFSDAAGSFVAEWVVINGKPFRTVLTSSDDISHLFMRNIDPPYYE
jgi:hypothetical protein